jgi:hypothetical protein
MTTTVRPLDQTSARAGTWGGGIWAAVIVGALCGFLLALVELALINLGASASCRDLPTMSNVRDGELDLIVALCFGLVPWVIALAISPRRVPLSVAAAFAASPLVVGILIGLDPGFWDNGFCF